jgi:hypothetical protein
MWRHVSNVPGLSTLETCRHKAAARRPLPGIVPTGKSDANVQVITTTD